MENYSARILCLILITWAAVPSLATVYTVGDSGGWALGVDYSSWTSGKTFTVGDSLLFNYQSSHSVDEVTANDYSTCTVGSAISTDNSGSTTIPLKTPGPHYFICGVIGHCGGGMKLSVTVTGGVAGNGSTTTPPSTITPPSGTATTSSTLPSSSGTLSPFVALFFTLMAVIFKWVLS